MTSYTQTLTEQIKLNDSFGKPNQIFVYIYDADPAVLKWKEVEGVEYFKVEKELNQMSKFEMTLPQIEASQKLYVKEYAKVLLISNQKLILKGRIQKVNYETSYSAHIEGYGMEAVILDKEYKNATLSPDDEDRVQYTNWSAQSIAKDLLSTSPTGSAPWSPYTMNPRTYGLFATDYGNISMRYEYANKLTALGSLAGAIKYDWWIDHDPLTYTNDYFNIASIRGNQTDPSGDINRQFTITGANVNCEGTNYQKDVTNIANYIKCYDKQTEVLTKNGFKFFKDVTFNDEIATLNPTTYELEYYKSTAIQQFKYSGKLLKFKNRQVDLLVTPDHRIFCKPINSEFQITQAKDIFGKEIRFKKDAIWNGNYVPYFTIKKMSNSWNTEDNSRGYRKRNVKKIWNEINIPIKLWIKFMGWYLSEGCLNKSINNGYKIIIRQCKEDNLEEIYTLIKEMGFKPFKCKGKIEFYHKPLWKYLEQFGFAKDKFIPQDIKDLPKEELDLFINTLFKGDGWFNKNNGRLMGYCSISKRLIDDVSEILLKLGLGCKLSFRKRNAIIKGNKFISETYELSINYSYLNPKVGSEYQTIIDYNDFVYDVTVPNHILFVRRNGVSLWSGNCVGYGDGINQLFTSTYNASPIWSTLSANISTSDATISLVDSSSFAASGTVRIAEEIITYTGNTSNQLTGCTRGTSSTTAKAHRSGCYIEKYVAYTSPEANSSISTNGLMELTITNRDIRDESTLELVASNELINRMDPIERITLIPTDPNTVAETIEIGDLISVIDSESSLNSNYRVVGITYENSYGDLSISIEASNASLTFIEQMQKERERNQALQKYMQGSTNIYWFGRGDNCDATHPLEINIFIPEDVLAINKVNLRFNRESFRGYINVGSNKSSYLIQVPTYDREGNTTSFTSSIDDNIDNDGTFINHSVGMGIINLSDSTHYYRMHIECPDGTIISSDNGTATAGGATSLTDSSKTWTEDAWISYLVQITGGTGSGQIRRITDNDANILTITPAWDTNPSTDSTYIIYGWEGQLADIAGSQMSKIVTTDKTGLTWKFKWTPATGETYAMFKGDNSNAFVFTNMADFGIYEPASESDVNVAIKVESSTVTTINTVAVGYESPADIDLTSYITGTGWFAITLTPTGTSRLNASGYVKCFIEST